MDRWLEGWLDIERTEGVEKLNKWLCGLLLFKNNIGRIFMNDELTHGILWLWIANESSTNSIFPHIPIINLYIFCYYTAALQRVLKIKWKLPSCVQLFGAPWALQSMEFSRPEDWSGKPSPSPGDLPNPGIKPRSPVLQADSLPADPPGKPSKSLELVLIQHSLNSERQNEI